MLKYNTFTKMESVVCDCHSQLPIFEVSIINGVRGLRKDLIGLTPYANCEYLGELAERCEERNLATDTRSLRSILIAFIMETKEKSEEDFLYNQFEIFENIYKRKLGKDYSILDEILIKKCKSQISEKVEDFDIDYEKFNKETFIESTVEEKVLTALALTSYRCYVEETRLSKYDELTEAVLKLIASEKETLLNTITYISLSHVYEMILGFTKAGDFGKFSKQEKNFYKCIKEVAITDMNKIFNNPDIFKEEFITICEYQFKLEDVVKFSTDSMECDSTEMMIKKGNTLPMNCRKIAIHFNYFLSKGIIKRDDISKMQALYRMQNKYLYNHYLMEYFYMSSIEDVILYCELLKEIESVLQASNIYEDCKKNESLSNIGTMKWNIDGLVGELCREGDFDKIAEYDKKYELFEEAVERMSSNDPEGYVMYREVNRINKKYYYLSASMIQMLLDYNCIDSDFNIKIGDYEERLDVDRYGTVVSTAWDSNQFLLAIMMIKKHKACMDRMIEEHMLNSRGSFDEHLTYSKVIETFNRAEGSEVEKIIIDMVLNILIRGGAVSVIKKVMKSKLDKIVDIYSFDDEEKQALIRELISENIDIEKKTMMLEEFMVTTIGLDNCFKLLDVDEDTIFEMKMDYINKGSDSWSGQVRRYVEILKETLTEKDLLRVEIKKHRDYMKQEVKDSYLSGDSIVKYLNENKEVIMTYCIDDLINFIECRLSLEGSTKRLSGMPIIYIYLKSCKIEKLEKTLDILKNAILENCLN